MSLPGFSVRQVVLVNLVFAGLMVAGIQVWRRIPIDVFPDISFNVAVIVTAWPGASADEVERLVTSRIEEEIQDVAGVKEMFSFSGPGLSEINVEWQETLSDAEYEGALNDLRAAIDRVTDLPDDAEAPYLWELSVSEVYNICMVAVTDVGGVGEFTLREVARKLEKRIERIPGVRKAVLRGARDREIRVYVDGDRAHRYDLTLTEISSVIARNNQNFPAGTFTNPESQEITLRGIGNFPSPETLAATVVKKNPDGTHVTLAEVAEVVPDFETRRIHGRYNGHPTIMIGISKESDSDLMDVVDAVRRFLDDEVRKLPPGLEASLTWDTSKYVSARIELMRDNLLLGVVFVVFVLWLTVGFRNALLAIVAIPFSFLTALMLFPLFDVTINSLSLIGFVMVSGMLVDDAIIIIENIYRHIEEGKPLLRAVVEGAEEVMWPVTAAIATTIAAFTPMFLVRGTSGEFMSILPKTVILCLIGSLLEALVILPAHYLDWGSRTRASEQLQRRRRGTLGAIARASYGLRARVEGTLDAARDGYARIQGPVLEQRHAFLALSVATLVFSIALARHIPVKLFPSDFNNLFVTVESPTDYGVDQTNEVVSRIEEVMVGLGDELTDFTTYVGQGLTADQIPIAAPNYGIFFVSFPNTRENMEDPERVLERVRTRVAGKVEENPAGIENVLVAPPRNGPPIGKPVAVRVQADDYTVAKQLAEEIKRELRGMPGVYNVEDNLPHGPRELRVALDEHRASIHGLGFEQVGATLRAANDGLMPSSFKDPRSDEDVDIRVMLREEQRKTIAQLLDVGIRTPAGYTVKLGDVARISMERSYQRLYHFDAQRAVVVYADVDGERATSLSVNRELQARFADVSLRYPGVSLVFGGEFQRTREAFEDLGRAFLVAVIAIYAILAAQFRSYLQPLVVMSVVGFAYIGVILGMWVMGYSLSMYVLYAIVGLAGVVVNDSLVLMDFVNRERGRGTPLLEAVRVASRRRFRAIMLTTVTTIAGLLPMAAGLQGTSVVFSPFAAAIVFGLAVASLLTLFVVPSLYLTLEDAKLALRRWREARRSLAGAPGTG